MCIDNGKITKIKNNEFGEPDYQGACDRLVSRELGNKYFCNLTCKFNLIFRPEITEFRAEACRAIGNLTEYSGKFFRFKIVD